MHRNHKCNVTHRIANAVFSINLYNIFLGDCFEFCNYNLDEIVTPIAVEKLQELLFISGYDHSKSQELVQGFTQGFDIGYRGPSCRQDTSANIPLTVGTHADIWGKVMKEVQSGRYVGPYEHIPYKNYMQSPIGLVPKAGGQTRLIFHLSFNFGSEEETERKSLNFHTPQEWCTVKYRDLDHAVLNSLKLIEGCKESITVFYSKSDLRAAFRILPVKPSQRGYLILKAVHPGSKKTYFFVEKNLPFGASISCARFQAFSNALQHIVEFMAGVSC